MRRNLFAKHGPRAAREPSTPAAITKRVPEDTNRLIPHALRTKGEPRRATWQDKPMPPVKPIPPLKPSPWGKSASRGIKWR